MRKVLITGGTGTVGKSFIERYYNDYGIKENRPMSDDFSFKNAEKYFKRLIFGFGFGFGFGSGRCPGKEGGHACKHSN